MQRASHTRFFRLIRGSLRRSVSKALTFATAVLLIAVVNDRALHGQPGPSFQQKPARSPQYPLKTGRMIYSDEEIALARANILHYPEARKVKDSIVRAADKWLTWSDEDLLELLAGARVPRAFDVNPKGCPVHGKEVFNKGGPYPWIIDPRRPFQIICPVGKEKYPSNDYAAWYKSGFKERKGWGSAFTDDGWGWVASDGERYWFVAYANHWVWRKYAEPALLDLGRAYLLTRDKRYAHKAAVMLYRIAEVYPSMDYATQSRYGLLSRAAGRLYTGKLFNMIWETSFIQSAAEAYDAVWDSIDDDSALQELTGKNGREIRAFIEANLLEEALDAYFERRIQGNYGMHQSALLYVLLARQHMDTQKYLRLLVDEPGEDRPHTGLRYAIRNQIFRDGLPLESPQYNMIWVRRLAVLGELLQKTGLDLFAIPGFKKLFDGPPDLVAAGKYTVDLGDGGSVTGGIQGRSPDAYQIAYAAYRDPGYLQWLAGIRRTGGQTFSGFASLFREKLPETSPMDGKRAVPAQPSRLFAGYGLGILNNERDETAVAMTYGMHVAHYHWDFLNFELFAGGQKMMPDLGYPDAMNAYVPGIYAWSKNTIAHNTVVVDAQRQNRNLPGVLHDFADGGFARVMDASSPAYSQTSQYRRAIVMVDVDERQSYVVDFFRVSGGKQHDYSLHGPPGTVTTQEGSWSRKQSGTLAGPEIQVGQFYDDQQLGDKDYSGGYTGYKGSGFQYLFNVQRLEEGKGLLEYRHLSDTNACLRIHLLQAEPQLVYMADAYGKPRAKAHLLKYLIARRTAPAGEQLKSRFVSVMEPYRGKVYIRSVRLLQVESTGGGLPAGEGLAVEVKRRGMRDIIISDTGNVVKRLAAYRIETDATHAVVTLNGRGEPLRVFFSGGTYLSCGGRHFRAAAIKGTVVEVNSREGSIRVRPESGSMEEGGSPDPAALAGRIAHFSNEYHHTVHPLSEAPIADGDYLIVRTKDALLTGVVRLSEAAGQAAFTSTNLPFSLLYDGVTLLNEDFIPVEKLRHVRKGKLTMAGKPAVVLNPGDDLWFANVGAGDKMEIKPVFSWTAAGGH